MQGGDFTHACNWRTTASRRGKGKDGMKGNFRMMIGTGKPLTNATGLGRSYNSAMLFHYDNCSINSK